MRWVPAAHDWIVTTKRGVLSEAWDHRNLSGCTGATLMQPLCDRPGNVTVSNSIVDHFPVRDTGAHLK